MVEQTKGTNITMALFDKKAEHYDDFCQTPLGAFVDTVERKLVRELMNPQAGENLVDLGCGTGSITVDWASLGCHMTGVDESAMMLAKARAKPVRQGTADYIQADLARLPYPSAYFHGGLLQVTLEFVQEPAAVLQEAVRVIKPGGRLVIGLINASGPWARYYQERAKTHSSSVYRRAHFFTQSTIDQLLRTFPSAVRGGLYIGPTEFLSEAQGWLIERRRTAERPLAEAGFLVLRYDLDQEAEVRKT